MITMRHVVDTMIAEGTLPADSHDEIAALYGAETADSVTPWYMRALLGASAWIAAILLLLFLFGMSIIRDETGALGLGIVLCVTTVVVQRVAKNNLFLGQLALALSLTGQVLVIGGLGVLADSVTVAALAAIVLQSVLIAVYADRLHRFLSTLSIIAALMVLVFEWEADLLLHGFVMIAALGTVFLWKRELELAVARMEDVARPVAYGLTFGLFALVSLHVFDEGNVRYWWLSTLGLMVVLMVQLVDMLREYRVIVDRKLMAGLGGFAIILATAALDMPGLVAALIVLLLGFRHGNRLLLGLALVFLAVFIGAFYYSLSLTLLGKSLALIGSGIALFGVRWMARRLTEPREVIL